MTTETEEKRERSRSPRRALGAEEVAIDLEEEDAQVPDTPEVASMVRLDAAVLKVNQETNAEIQKLLRAKEAKVRELTKQRAEILKGSAPRAGCGTPAVDSFWGLVLEQAPEFMEQIQEWDKPILNALQDITFEWLDESGENGFKLYFHFVENDYFSNTTLAKAYTTEKREFPPNDPDTIDCTRIDVDKIEWKEGKNVTVQMVKGKPAKGKPAKAGRPREVPKESFFRWFFRNLGGSHAPPPDLEFEQDEDGEDEEPEDAIQRVLDEDHEAAQALMATIIPHAVLFYKGEFAEDEEEEEEDSEEEDSEEEDTDDSED